MSISVGEDEHDKKQRGMREVRKEIVQRHAQDTGAAEELASRLWQIDRTAISNPNPEYAYRLVDRRKDGEKIKQRQGRGYETVPEDDEAQLNEGAKVDGTQVTGDLVLMRTPIANYEKHREERRKRWEFMSGDNKRQEAEEKMAKVLRDSGRKGSVI